MNKNPLINIYWESTRPLRFLTILTGTLASIGMYLRSGSPSEDMALLNTLAPWYLWSSILMLVSIFRLYVLLVPENSFKRIELCMYIRSFGGLLAGVCGIVIWSILFVSFSIAKDFGLGLLLLIPCIIEVWLLSRSLVSYNYATTICKRKRRNE